jgi:hypothetical protein
MKSRDFSNGDNIPINGANRGIDRGIWRNWLTEGKSVWIRSIAEGNLRKSGSKPTVVAC